MVSGSDSVQRELAFQVWSTQLSRNCLWLCRGLRWFQPSTPEGALPTIWALWTVYSLVLLEWTCKAQVSIFIQYFLLGSVRFKCQSSLTLFCLKIPRKFSLLCLELLLSSLHTWKNSCPWLSLSSNVHKPPIGIPCGLQHLVQRTRR